MIAVTMTEDELLLGLTQALTIAGWRWTHIINSHGVTMGDPGLPDIIAVHPTRGQVLAWELKGSGGSPSRDQVAWIRSLAALGAPNLDARILYPVDYDTALEYIVGKRAAFVVCIVCGEPALRVLDTRSDAGLCVTHDDLDV